MEEMPSTLAERAYMALAQVCHTPQKFDCFLKCTDVNPFDSRNMKGSWMLNGK